MILTSAASPAPSGRSPAKPAVSARTRNYCTAGGTVDPFGRGRTLPSLPSRDEQPGFGAIPIPRRLALALRLVSAQPALTGPLRSNAPSRRSLSASCPYLCSPAAMQHSRTARRPRPLFGNICAYHVVWRNHHSPSPQKAYHNIKKHCRAPPQQGLILMVATRHYLYRKTCVLDNLCKPLAIHQMLAPIPSIWITRVCGVIDAISNAPP